MSSLRHRGPDDAGWTSLRGGSVLHGRDGDPAPGEVVFLHTRLSIIDLSQRAAQPMSSPDGRFQLVFNGEIYNYVELRDELAEAGHAFRSDSDTEVLLEAWREWGTDALRRLIGMFAFAIADRHERAVWVARDPFGIKPLYLAAAPGGGTAFASEIPPLLALPGVSRAANPERLFEFLRLGLTDHGAETLFRDVQQLASARYARIAFDAPNRVEQVPYWEPPSDEPLDLSLDEAAARLRELFLDNVRIHLRSDVPVGVAFSGGIDSSANLTAMRAIGGADLDLRAFSYVADDPLLTEERWIDSVSRATSASTVKVTPARDDLIRDLDDLIETQAEPFGSTSIYAQYCVFRLAGEHGMKVMLDGQGSDELFAGYEFYRAARLATLLRHLRLAEASRFLRAASAAPGAPSARDQALQAVGLLVPSGSAAGLRRLVGRELLPSWLNGRWFLERGVQPHATPQPHNSSILNGQLRTAVSTTSLPMLLRYEDRNSMRFSIESRVPFLTTPLVDFALSLPEHLVISGDATTKCVLRAALRGLVPDAVLDRRDKIGFATPEREWLSSLQPWVNGTFADETASHVAPIQLAEARRQWESIIAGRAPFGPRVWRWINVIRWTSQFDVTYS